MNKRALLLTALVALPLGAHAFERKDAELAMTEAGTAVQAAQRADAMPADLSEAQAMMASAQGAYDRHHWQESVFFAENARVDADLAAARTRQHRAEASTAELDRSVRALRAQMTTGATP